MPAKKNKRRPAEALRPSTTRTPPAFVTPMAAQIVKSLPDGDEWIYEVKFDGYRGLLLKDRERVELRSRNDKDLTRMYPAITTAALLLNAERAVVDGEIVALDTQGRPTFQALQHRSSHPHHQIVFYTFDLLHLDGRDLTREPLLKRRAHLRKVLEGSKLVLSQELPGTAAAIVEAVRRLGLEGVSWQSGRIRSTSRASVVASGRSSSWRISKSSWSGYRSGSNGVDALLVGYYDDSGLRFAGKVRAGFVPHSRRDLHRKLTSLHVDVCPFVNLPDVKSLGRSRRGGRDG